MKEVNIPHLSADLLPEFRFRVATLERLLGVQYGLTEIQLVLMQGTRLIGFEALSREDWLATLGDKIAETMEHKTFAYVGDLVRDLFEKRVEWNMALSLTHQIGPIDRWWLLTTSEGTLWVAVVKHGYRRATVEESAELQRAATRIISSYQLEGEKDETNRTSTDIQNRAG